MPFPQEQTYTVKNIYALPEGQRAELIDGQIYYMAPPGFLHQKLVMELSATLRNFIKSNGGNCEILPAPFAVFLSQDEINYVEPDISVICDKNKIDEKGCNGAPDWIAEIISPSTQQMDYGVKLFKYRTAGVREYWIVNPFTRTVNVYDFEQEKGTCQYSFDENIPVCLFKGFAVRIADLLR